MRFPENPWHRYLLIMAVLTAVFAAGWFANDYEGTLIGDQSNTDSDLTQSTYRFTNPSLECTNRNTFTRHELMPFRAKTEAKVNEILAQKNLADKVSVYFRDLNNGPWFGINENVEFSPASLLKIPIMMSYFKIAETDPTILTQVVKYQPSAVADTRVQIPPKNRLTPGDSYTVDELIKRMIIYSDNEAAAVLFSGLKKGEYNDPYKMVEIDPPTGNADYNISVRKYSSFFRLLFNASYLNRAYSDRALFYASQSDFKEGIVAGVPGNIQVSHKFGERQYPDSNERQLHDCGIVYYPKYPYLLCIMTRGDSTDNLEKAVKAISKTVYDEVDAQRQGK